MTDRTGMPSPRRRHRERSALGHTTRAAPDEGFSLLEVMVTIGMATVLMTIAVSSWNSYAHARAHQGAADTIQSVLRQAQQRAVTEGRSTCVVFDTPTRAWTLYRGSCEQADRAELETGRIEEDYLNFTEATFVTGVDQQSSGVTFRSRGTATPGRVVVAREGSGTTRLVRVEGLTGRVSVN